MDLSTGVHVKNFLTEENQEEKEEADPRKNIAIGGVFAGFLAIVGGTAYYFKIYKPRKEQEVEKDEGLEHMEDFESVEEDR